MKSKVHAHSYGSGIDFVEGFNEESYTAVGAGVRNMNPNIPEWTRVYMEKLGFIFNKDKSTAIQIKDYTPKAEEELRELGGDVDPRYWEDELIITLPSGNVITVQCFNFSERERNIDVRDAIVNFYSTRQWPEWWAK